MLMRDTEGETGVSAMLGADVPAPGSVLLFSLLGENCGELAMSSVIGALSFLAGIDSASGFYEAIGSWIRTPLSGALVFTVRAC